MNDKEARVQPRRLMAQIAAGAFALLAWLQTASAAPLLETPVYNPHTKSYFVLVKVGPVDTNTGIAGSEYGNFWFTAQEHAQEHVFKGVHGRLAVVRDLDTTLWVETTLRPPDEVWIGLHYICNGRQLQWTDGTYFRPGDFQLWSTQWWQSEGHPCAEFNTTPDLPVELYKDSRGVHWAARGRYKTFSYYIMEYPTGQP